MYKKKVYIGFIQQGIYPLRNGGRSYVYYDNDVKHICNLRIIINHYREKTYLAIDEQLKQIDLNLRAIALQLLYKVRSDYDKNMEEMEDRIINKRSIQRNRNIEETLNRLEEMLLREFDKNLLLELRNTETNIEPFYDNCLDFADLINGNLRIIS